MMPMMKRLGRLWFVAVAVIAAKAWSYGPSFSTKKLGQNRFQSGSLPQFRQILTKTHMLPVDCDKFPNIARVMYTEAERLKYCVPGGRAFDTPDTIFNNILSDLPWLLLLFVVSYVSRRSLPTARVDDEVKDAANGFENSMFQPCPQCNGKKVFLNQRCDVCGGQGFLNFTENQLRLTGGVDVKSKEESWNDYWKRRDIFSEGLEEDEGEKKEANGANNDQNSENNENNRNYPKKANEDNNNNKNDSNNQSI